MAPRWIRFSRSTLLALIFVALSLPLHAAGLVEGTDYRTLDPPQHSDSPPGKIEVLEFFSWGCPHCNEFNPLITKWAENAPKDIVFKRVATGMGRTAWTNLAKAYYALESLGAADRLNAPMFHAIHEEHQPLFDEGAITAWVGKHGVDEAKFRTAFDSFGVNTRLNQAEQMVENYKIEGVPSLAVGGKYIVLGNSYEEMMTHLEAVVAKVRAERTAAAHK
jgi:protein dithiol oxidoreductase (disulfide-forming)